MNFKKIFIFYFLIPVVNGFYMFPKLPLIANKPITTTLFIFGDSIGIGNGNGNGNDNGNGNNSIRFFNNNNGDDDDINIFIGLVMFNLYMIKTNYYNNNLFDLFY